MHQICQTEFIEKNVKLNELRTHILMSTKAEKKRSCLRWTVRHSFQPQFYSWKCAKHWVFQNNIGMQFFFWATNLPSPWWHMGPLFFSDCQLLLGEAAASFTRNELAHALRKGPFQADKPCQKVGIHASTPCNPAGRIDHLIWYGICYSRRYWHLLSTYVIRFHLFAMFWSHHGGHHGSHPLFFDYCLLHCSTDLFEALRKLIDHDFQRKPRGRSAHCRSGQRQPQSLFHGGCLRCSVCIKVWCDALRTSVSNRFEGLFGQ